MRNAFTILLAVFSFPVFAEPQDYLRQLERCGIDPKPRLPPVEAIEGCTLVINSGKATPRILAEAYVNRGDAYRMRHNDIDLALADYNQAIRSLPGSPMGFASRGFVYLFSRHQPDQAIDDFNEAIRLDPTSANVFYYRGVAWSDKRDWSRAIADFDRAIRLRPTFSIAYRDRGNAKQANGDGAGGAADVAEAERLGRLGTDCVGAVGCGR